MEGVSDLSLHGCIGFVPAARSRPRSSPCSAASASAATPPSSSSPTRPPLTPHPPPSSRASPGASSRAPSPPPARTTCSSPRALLFTATPASPTPDALTLAEPLLADLDAFVAAMDEISGASVMPSAARVPLTEAAEGEAAKSGRHRGRVWARLREGGSPSGMGSGRLGMGGCRRGFARVREHTTEDHHQVFEVSSEEDQPSSPVLKPALGGGRFWANALTGEDDDERVSLQEHVRLSRPP
ncbi:hypothetical protein ZWY2020_024271 [Hordeum vulgare]|nr:hypothetical protein ZWY2020_024271 [Hordeum vulgare]